LFGYHRLGFTNDPGANYLAVVWIGDSNGSSFSNFGVCRHGVLDLDREKILGIISRKYVKRRYDGNGDSTNFSAANDDILEFDLREK